MAAGELCARRPPPRVFRNGELAGRIEWCGDAFGRMLPLAGQGVLPIGSVVECTVPHCDPTTNLHDVLHVVRGTISWRNG